MGKVRIRLKFIKPQAGQLKERLSDLLGSEDMM